MSRTIRKLRSSKAVQAATRNQESGTLSEAEGNTGHGIMYQSRASPQKVVMRLGHWKLGVLYPGLLYSCRDGEAKVVKFIERLVSTTLGTLHWFANDGIRLRY